MIVIWKEDIRSIRAIRVQKILEYFVPFDVEKENEIKW